MGGKPMKMTRMAAALAVTMTAAAPALAESLHFPMLNYRTGPFGPNGMAFADGYQDYLTLINERDGGINGVPIRMTECETAYNTERGVECYQGIRGDDPLVIQPLSTGITYQLIPRTMEDRVPMHTMGYGRTSAVNGEVFNWTFNYPANYWDGASVIINYLLEENDGSLDGKKIVLLYHNSAYGREPIPTLERLSERHGYEFLDHRCRQPGPGTGQPVAADPPRTAGLRGDVGLGRDERRRHPGSRQHPLPDGELHRRLVVGLRAGRASGRRRRAQLQVAGDARDRARLPDL
jgi:branched-chain amino acid transport system substrate-binding protein